MIEQETPSKDIREHVLSARITFDTLDLLKREARDRNITVSNLVDIKLSRG